MTNLIAFQFESQEVRFVDGKPVANDVARVLGFKDPANAVSRMVKPKHKGLCKMQTPGGMQSVTVLEEPGIWTLVLGSKLPSAERFQDWLVEEALPSIRKTGSYSATQPKKAITHYGDRIADIRKHLTKPQGYWCVIEKCNHLLLEVENAGYAINQYDLLDGSVGSRWATYREEIGLNTPTEWANYLMPKRMKKPVSIRAYSSKELGIFSDWLETIYEPRYLNNYLKGKYGNLVKT